MPENCLSSFWYLPHLSSEARSIQILAVLSALILEKPNLSGDWY